MNPDFHTDQDLDALYRLNARDDADAQMLRDSITTMENEATRLKDAGRLGDAEKWEKKAAAKRAELARLLPPQRGG